VSTAASLPDRRRAELHAKLASVEAEFRRWRDVSEKGQPLRKHYSQIRRVTKALERIRERIAQDLDAAAGDDVLAQARHLERSILELHRLWDYFRSKFVLRQVTWFQEPLYVVDELTWACYQPLQLAVAANRPTDLKEPPLSFFNGAWSPFAAGRGRVYEPERVEGALLSTVSARDAIRKLPIPVIGVPWYLAEHLADSPVVCHEIGHVAEQDFGLTDAISSALEGAAIPPNRGPAWRSWCSEVFADVYGCAGTGSAFVSALMGFLTDAPAAVEAQNLAAPGWGKYPTADLRVAFNIKVLREMELGAAADGLEERWRAYYHGDRMSAFHADAGPVAKALLTTPLAPLGEKVALADVLTFGPAAQSAAEQEARGLLLKKSPDPSNPRRLHAAVRLAFDTDPGLFADAGVAARARAALWNARDEGVRRAAPAPPLADLEAVDVAAGDAIYDALLTSDGAGTDEEQG
jgi:hypothetical protein